MGKRGARGILDAAASVGIRKGACRSTSGQSCRSPGRTANITRIPTRCSRSGSSGRHCRARTPRSGSKSPRPARTSNQSRSPQEAASRATPSSRHQRRSTRNLGPMTRSTSRGCLPSRPAKLLASFEGWSRGSEEIGGGAAAVAVSRSDRDHERPGHAAHLARPGGRCRTWKPGAPGAEAGPPQHRPVHVDPSRPGRDRRPLDGRLVLRRKPDRASFDRDGGRNHREPPVRSWRSRELAVRLDRRTLAL